MIHVFIFNLLYKGLKIYPDILPVGMGEILFFVCAMLFSIAGVYVLKIIPGLREIV